MARIMDGSFSIGHFRIRLWTKAQISTNRNNQKLCNHGRAFLWQTSVYNCLFWK